ncbi:hypothetical protein HJC23_010155 [Cyclotella cryptica]|uniref:Circumsporozoite protein n=1 Tax=Cyclotella cryptica TaxID=29204 RepID=A0ABD3P5G9_9STRA
MISAQSGSVGGRSIFSHQSTDNSDNRELGCDARKPAPPEGSPLRIRRGIFFALLFLLPFVIFVVIFHNRPESVRNDVPKSANISACLCEGSNGTASRDLPHSLGMVSAKSYSCLRGNSARLMKRSPLSMCLFLGDSSIFGIYQIRKLNLTHLASGSVLQVAHASSNSSSSAEIHPWATVHTSRNRALLVVQIQHLEDDWFDSTKERSIDIRGNVMIRPLTLNEGNATIDRAVNITRKIHFTAKTIATSYPFPSIACSCSATQWNEGSPDALGIVHRSNEPSVSYSCNAGNFVSKAVPTTVCLSIRGLTIQGHRLQRLLSFNVTHLITGSVIRTMYPFYEGSINSTNNSWSSIERSLDQTLWVFHLDNDLDPWIDAFLGTTFDINTAVTLEPANESTTAQQSTLSHQVVQVFRFTLQSVPLDASPNIIFQHDVGSIIRDYYTSRSTGPAVTTESTGLQVCVCDGHFDCVDDLSPLLLQNVRLCLSMRRPGIGGIESMFFQLPNGHEYPIIRMSLPQYNTEVKEYEGGGITVETTGPFGFSEGQITDLEVRGIVSSRPSNGSEPVDLKFSLSMKFSFDSNAWIRSSFRSTRIAGIDTASQRTSYSVEPSMTVQPNIQLEFCACDIDNVCFDTHVALSYLNSLIKICLSALPGYAQINITYVTMIASQLSLPSLSFEVHYNDTHKNLAYVTAPMTADFFATDHLHGLTIVGTSNIVAGGGREADAGFLVHYTLNDLVPPDDIGDYFYISFNVTEDPGPLEDIKENDPVMPSLQACKCDTNNVCDGEALLPNSPDLRLCFLASYSAIVEIVSLWVKQRDGNEQNIIRMSESQQEQTSIKKYGRGGLVIETVLPLHFFERSENLEASGIISLRPNDVSMPTNVEFNLPLHLFYENGVPAPSNFLTKSPSSTMSAVVPTYHTTSNFMGSSLPPKAAIRFDFCACSTNRICTSDDPVGVTSLNPVIRICIIANPDHAKLNVTYTKMLTSEPSHHTPNLEIQYDEVNKNMAIVTAKLPSAFFAQEHHSDFIVVGKSNIFVVGARGRAEAGFLVRYDIRPVTQSPTYFPTTTASPSVELPLGARACQCGEDSNLCSKDIPYLSFDSRGAYICVYSTPQNSELVQINMLVLEVESYGVSQVLIIDDKAVFNQVSMIIANSRTRRVHVRLPEDFFLAVLAPGHISLKGFATVKVASSDVHATPSVAEFSLGLEFVDDSTSFPAPGPFMSLLPSVSNSRPPFPETSNSPVPSLPFSSPDFPNKPLVAKATVLFDFCACDSNNVCLNQNPVRLGPMHSEIRICLFAHPNNAELNVTYTKMLYAQTSPFAPTLEVLYDEVNKNMAIVTAKLPSAFFAEEHLSDFVIVGKSNIFVVGARGRAEAGFLVKYDIRPVTQSPTYFPTTTASPSVELPLGARACQCGEDSNLCLKDIPYLGFDSRDAYICVYSTPQNSELIQINMLVLEVESYGVSQLVIVNNEVVDESSINSIDSRTQKVHLTLLQDFFLAVPAPEQIRVQGIATVKDTISDVDSSLLTAEFTLDLDLFQNMTSFPDIGTSMSVAPSLTPTLRITVAPSALPPVDSDEGLSTSNLIDSTISPTQTGIFSSSTESPSQRPTAVLTPNPAKSTENVTASSPTTQRLDPTGAPSRRQADYPTKTPTTTPSKVPTKETNKVPTTTPTRTQTEMPPLPSIATSKKPTSAPTQKLTSAQTSVAPTLKPTISNKKPTAAPTPKLAEAPTHNPTNAPTRTPTLAPAQEPTLAPANKPTSPTSAPTQKPSAAATRNQTMAPTQKPTTVPTRVPIKKLTQAPTRNPTNAITEKPTLTPSQKPITAPTKKPTSAPTPKPSAAPTNEPSMHPTQKPTTAPTSRPTAMPTDAPTRNPTNTPSGRPTLVPTPKPTMAPTKRPTSTPTRKLTIAPTQAVTRKPTMSPTTKPTLTPARPPTNKPSLAPTRNPTTFPTKKPTLVPTRNPTIAPTKKPTSVPTQKPSGEPTRKPTTVSTLTPAESPTKKPSAAPTKSPTKRPTLAPTRNPRTFPTKKPTLAPTRKPTIVPTKKPTSVPTQSAPTQKPSTLPTLAPTKSPNKSPTVSPTPTPTKKPSKDPTTSPTIPPSRSPSGSPSQSPTRSPSAGPSALPSVSPSASPSTSPSGSPSRSPSGSPSQSPSGSPSQSPSRSPSAGPSASPSVSPSASPSTSPSGLPSRSPSGSPSQSPSRSPSAGPSASPSVSPSASPSTGPSGSPSRSPSGSPSQSPSRSPSAGPSASPSVSPSASPSTSPSGSPSRSPSGSPSQSPSRSPSAGPSASPSVSPSASPSTGPSGSPSRSPSGSPSQSPSRSPSAGPSASPSVSPSASPSTGPSGSPSRSPSGSPSQSPSRSPSAGPSASPSVSPSASPSTGPSGSPSRSPSGSPSQSPSRSPSAGPSASPSVSPSASPSTGPSGSPSRSPSGSPSQSPSRSPSAGPSASPSVSPSASPSTGPSGSPSRSPSGSPSQSPSRSPSAGPSASPSVSPSASPSTGPSGSPSRSPSGSPSQSPSRSPSAGPSASPSVSPSASPSTGPSGSPSRSPSGSPSQSPSRSPSAGPSASPSVSPSASPSTGPSGSPSRSPSGSPSQSPSRSPSAGPSASPSVSPSASPSTGPSGSPSRSPSGSPSQSPSRSPSAGPSASPSVSPSASPSTGPSGSPSRSPSGSPSQSPSRSPSAGPSASPSVSPSASPSTGPSGSPSRSPSGSPSQSPSRSPSAGPSASPSVSPSASPSTGPSGSPSRSPSGSPSQSPSRSPSAGPSASPSVSPSASPSTGPSGSPSRSPSGSPSQSPSRSPSAGPSASPSVSPSASPSTSPSGSPSRSPSGSPSQSPSRSPSAGPSASPSVSPSASPSTGPSGSPSRSPSGSPSQSPSRSPSAGPSASPSVSPSASPSTSPSGSPSRSPSGSPSQSPSRSPSAGPSASPSVSPSASPSTSPSGSPSRSPSGSPSQSPSRSPSAGPSASPSVSPSASPSTGPSGSPSRSPSGSPSQSPSRSPSAGPSASPSVSPSASPSTGPSGSPSRSPSGSPSQSPSRSPSAGPSASPSVSPSASPSTSPSGSPSRSPSGSPSQSPSRSPSAGPSASPSVSPSASPSIGPSSSPSRSPSGSPSQSPSRSPSAGPSASPSVSPSASPSTGPSGSPSRSPSGSPSQSPSRSPSAGPSASPSVSPSASPSTGPSGSPSRSPSGSPSQSPSRSPSAGPSASPSVSPSASPSTSPSGSPSRSPSGSPSQSPSRSPSAGPSASPSVSPSASPSTGPSGSPSRSPSGSPSQSPSRSPSAGPSASPSVSPSASPSTGPSGSPSRSPSGSPSQSPSRSPSASPSASPSVSPSASPSTGPSGSPSRSPSGSPSQSPSRSPSAGPSASPSVSPSASPSTSPSGSPSRSPSGSPSSPVFPTLAPYVKPTTSPSNTQSWLPSVAPTPLPTDFSTAIDCGTWCLQNPSSLIGIDFYNDPAGFENGCYCLFNNGIPLVTGTYNPPFTKIKLDDVGVGPIANVSGDAHWLCYRNDDNIPPSGCVGDADCSYEQNCALDLCNAGHCAHFMQDYCCGNFICEEEDNMTSHRCSDCELLTISTPECYDCWKPTGFMFDVASSQDITIKSLRVQLWSGMNYVVVYTAPGNYADKATDPSKWTQIYRNSFVQLDGSFVTLDIGDVKMSGENNRSFYVASTGRLMAGNHSFVSDGTVTLLGPSRYVHSAGGLFGYGQDDISWVGGVTYTIAEIAEYDETLGAPFCVSFGSKCSSVDLLDGRGTVSGGNEPNRSNTIDGCIDGNYGTYHQDESIDKIVVKAGEIDGNGSEFNLEAGSRATIEATVYAYNDGSEDYADFYFATIPLGNTSWQYIGTVQPSQGGVQVLKIEYTLPCGESQAVRVNFRHFGSVGNCTNGAFSDRDDLVFSVVNAC